ncbi:MAG: hypothetical protein H7Z74_07380 [Anaerolineae bacterium]|nr:hypothetical protein [Gemmatimonadaceae bacterium]
MAETATPETKDPAAAAGAAVTPPVPRRPSGHRGADVRDTVAEMAARAQEISLEAGSKIAAAMKDVINAAAGVTGFATESARDLVQYMIRRGQMTQDEGEKLLREAEDANSKRPASTRVAVRPDAAKAPEAPVKTAPVIASSPSASVTSVARESAPKPAPRPAVKVGAQAKTKPVTSPTAKSAAKKQVARKPAPSASSKTGPRAASKSKAAPPRSKPKPKAAVPKKKKR